MLNRMFPKTLDNAYRGHWGAVAIMVLLLLGRFAMTINGTLNTAFVAVSADGIPLSSYDAAAAQTVIALFALAAISNLGLGLLGLVALLRYRAMLPLVYLLTLIQSVASRLVIWAHPIVRGNVPTATLGFAFVLGLLALTAIGFVLSLVPRKDRQN
ncbi:MAG: hypothetical protein JOZ13_06580 [Alphaproteobacteria bacterium]|nr:hypothetical protein [Alphaproteobacteria bacterium]